MALPDELRSIAEAAAAFAGPDEHVTGVLATEPLQAGRVYLCAYGSQGGAQSWLALDRDGRPVDDRKVVREATQLAALCELAEEQAGGGDLPQLRARLRELRETEAPAGIEEAEAAAERLARTLQDEPRVATTDYLDRLGAAARALEQSLGDDAGSPFAAVMQQVLPAVDRLAAEVERAYKGPLA